MSDQQTSMYEPRLCHIAKRVNFDGYGFNLHAEKGRPGQYIGKVDESSPSEEAGLRQGDRIIEVNGVNIGSESHRQVVERIKAVANHTKLLVIDPKADLLSQQQLAIIEKIKKSLDHENNNGKAMSADASDNRAPMTIDTSSNNNGSINPKISVTMIDDDDSMTTPTKEKKSDMNGNSNNNGNISIDSVDSSKSSMSSTSTDCGSSEGGVLRLTMTAAEMRAQLKSKKRPDIKSEGVDVRKKYEIIQKMWRDIHISQSATCQTLNFRHRVHHHTSSIKQMNEKKLKVSRKTLLFRFPSCNKVQVILLLKIIPPHCVFTTHATQLSSKCEKVTRPLSGEF